MAVIDYVELVQLVKNDSRYAGRWDCGVRAEVALSIRFSRGGRQPVTSETFEILGGGDIVLDCDADGKVVGIEIL